MVNHSCLYCINRSSVIRSVKFVGRNSAVDVHYCLKGVEPMPLLADEHIINKCKFWEPEQYIIPEFGSRLK